MNNNPPNQNSSTIIAINQAIASNDFSSILFISKQLDLLLVSDALRQPNGYPAKDDREVKFTNKFFPFGIALTHYYFASKELVREIEATLAKVKGKVDEENFRMAYDLYEVARDWSNAFEGWVAENERRIALAGTQQSLVLSSLNSPTAIEEEKNDVLPNLNATTGIVGQKRETEKVSAGQLGLFG